MTNRRAIVTLALGEQYAGFWHTYCERNWRAYGERNGYDVICIDEPIDASSRAQQRSPTWQKLLVASQPFAARYEQLVWMDADFLINPSAPSVADAVPVERVGAVDEYATPSREEHAGALRTLYRHWDSTGVPYARNETAAEFYAAFGLPARHAEVVQAGLLVLSPRHHRGLLEKIYRSYEDPDQIGDMQAISLELLEAGVVEWIDHRFNYTWPLYAAQHFPFLLGHHDHPRLREAATAALHDVHFLHFAGAKTELALVDDRPPRRQAKTPAHVAPRGPLQTPVAVLLYTRPDTTRRLLDAVREQRPERLLVVADAAPAGDPAVAARCAEVRQLVEEEVDWDCHVTTDFASEHMGLKRRVESGLDWVFAQVEEAIVLEDDCIPAPTFFRYCAEMLDRHRDDERVMTVSGSNLVADPAADGSYRYSRYPLIWGWATWRRAWQRHDPAMARWPELRASGWLETIFGDRHAVAYWTHVFDETYANGSTWDYAWVLASWLHSGLSVVPAVNLVTNVGFRPDATHTREGDLSPFANMPVEPMRFPLAHPAELTRDAAADDALEAIAFSGNVHRMFERLRGARRLASAS